MESLNTANDDINERRKYIRAICWYRLGSPVDLMLPNRLMSSRFWIWEMNAFDHYTPWQALDHRSSGYEVLNTHGPPYYIRLLRE
jgi:hypothetical protein